MFNFINAPLMLIASIASIYFANTKKCLKDFSLFHFPTRPRTMKYREVEWTFKAE